MNTVQFEQITRPFVMCYMKNCRVFKDKLSLGKRPYFSTKGKF